MQTNQTKSLSDTNNVKLKHIQIRKTSNNFCLEIQLKICYFHSWPHNNIFWSIINKTKMIISVVRVDTNPAICNTLKL